MRITLVPAYGRDYKNKKAVVADFEAGKDFRVCDVSSSYDGSYFNKESAVQGGIDTVNIRYKQLRQIAVIKVK